MQTSELFTLLPEDLACTPDGMAIDKDGNLILSCPNFADLSMPSCVLKIDKDRNITKWFDVPLNEYSGEARAMGIEFGPDGDLYMVDNAGWTGEPHMVFTGRILRLKLNDQGVVKCTVVADALSQSGIRIWGDYMYVTQSCMTRQKTDSGKLMSCVYRFPPGRRGVSTAPIPWPIRISSSPLSPRTPSASTGWTASSLTTTATCTWATSATVWSTRSPSTPTAR